MKCTTYEKQINLINIEEDKFKISDVALKGDIKVVSMAGLQRTGKSFLLNQLVMGKGGKFEVGSTVQTCTKGINMVIKRNDNMCFWIRKVSDLPFDLKVST